MGEENREKAAGTTGPTARWWHIGLAFLLSLIFTVYVWFATHEQPPHATSNNERSLWKSGFTLIELSIVLVIIGLIVGGVLVGQDLIRSAAVRSQISQIEKYQTAVTSFRGKYNALPSDLNAATAKQYGFTPRGMYDGQGDGNGAIEGTGCPNASCVVGSYQAAGETGMFWVDLTTANGLNVNLIDGNFNAADPVSPPGVNIPSTGINRYLPEAKFGGGHFICVYSGIGGLAAVDRNYINYFALVTINTIYGYGGVAASPTLPVRQAFEMDKKLDDGLPTSGRVKAAYPYGNQITWTSGAAANTLNATNPYAAGATTCFDNGGMVGGVIPTYSMQINNGTGANCALSFQFQ